MPAIQVARTDTFEQQRQKINQIGSTLFSITAGGSDLSTGNLKLGDGTRSIPSLAFSSDSDLGLYKFGIGTLGFVSNNSDLFTLSSSELKSFKNLIFNKKTISTALNGISILDSGSGYSSGTYTSVPLLGGSGSGVLADITVVDFSGTSTNGTGYYSGTFSNISLTGGTGSNARINFTIDPIIGSITQAGSGYTAGTYTNTNLTGGSGTGAKADITVSSLSTTTTSGGSSYPNGKYLDVPLTTTTGSGSAARANITIGTGSVTVVEITNSGNGYAVSDTLGISLSQTGTQTFTVTRASIGDININGSIQSSFNLVSGKTYEFDQIGISNNSKPLCIGTTNGNTSSALGSADGVTYIINGTTYNTFSDYVANFSSGTTARKIRFVVPASPSNSNLFFFQGGFSGSLTLVSSAGSGAVLTVSNAPGIVTNVLITNSGSGYLLNDNLSASTIGGGSGFQFTVNNSPGRLNNFTFASRGTGYTSGNVLTLPGTISGVTGTLRATISNISTTLTSGNPNITVASNTGILAGYTVTVSSGTGAIAPNTTVSSVSGSTGITLSSNPTTSGSAILTFTPPNPTEVTVSNAAGINSGSIVSVTSGSGSLASGTTVVSASGTTVVLSTAPTGYGVSTLSFTPPYGPGSGWSYTINKIGSVDTVTIDPDFPGIGYNAQDLLTVSGSELSSSITYDVTVVNTQEFTLTGTVNYAASGLQPGNRIEVQGSGGSGSLIYDIIVSGGNIQKIVAESANFQSGNVIVEIGQTTPTFTIGTVTTGHRFFIDTGSGPTYAPDLTLYVGDTYVFDITDASNSGHPFLFSQFRDGIHSPSKVENVSTQLLTSSKDISVTSTSGILAGMLITKVSGDGVLVGGSRVISVNSGTNTVTISEFPQVSGAIVVTFTGAEYTNGVTKTASSNTIKITDQTVSPLYYYCQNHPDMSGSDGNEAVITISANNPRTLGSGLSIRVDNIVDENTITNDIEEGKIIALNIESTEATIATGDIDALTSTNITTTNLITQSISSSSLNVSSSGSIAFTTSGNITANGNVSIATNGNITTSGKLQTTDSVVVSDVLTISGSVISTTGSNDLIFNPATNRVAKVNTTTALVVPVGNTSQRPIGSIVSSGAIRFNTDTNQYEGYSGTTSSWSSLGGVRDLDGNTYIAAEASVGANDNTLYFYNDNNNTVRFTPSALDFRAVKTISSTNTSVSNFSQWNTNTPVSLNSYLQYRNNIYKVVVAGITGTSGNEPRHTTGIQVNGTSQLEWYALAVSPITFDLCSEVRIGPSKDVSLVVGSELRFSDNVISSDVQDIVIRPNTNKKLTIDAKTSLVIPSGTQSERGTPSRGSIRFNSTITQFEGYDGTNWSSLGGVRDVDGNTYIIPELSAGTNENILYFYNNGSNTLRLSSTELQFRSIDTLTSPITNELELTASLITFDNSETTLDNTSSTRTFLHGSKDYFDIGLSSGLTADPILRLDDQGDVYLNTGFGTGSLNTVKIFDNELKEFEISDFKISTSKVPLVKGTNNSSNVVVYDPAIHASAKVQIIAHNETTGDKEFVEYSVIDKGSDIFFTDFGNVKTGAELISCVFDFNASNNVRVTFTLDTALSTGNSVEVTVISNIVKR